MTQSDQAVPAPQGKLLTVALLEVWFVRYEQKLLAILTDIGLGEDDAMDLLLKIFTDLIQQARDIEAGKGTLIVDNEKQFLYQIARNAGHRFITKKGKAADSSEVPGSAAIQASDLPSDAINADQPRPVSIIAKQDEMERAKSAFYNHLTEEERRVYLLHDEKGMTYEQIAVETGLTADQVRRKYDEAKQHFRDRMGRFDSAMVREADDRTEIPETPEDLEIAFKQLPKPYDHYLFLHYFRRTSAKQIAVVEGLSEMTVAEKLRDGERLVERRFSLTPEAMRGMLAPHFNPSSPQVGE